jgi:hypothetical protein
MGQTFQKILPTLSAVDSLVARKTLVYTDDVQMLPQKNNNLLGEQ